MAQDFERNEYEHADTAPVPTENLEDTKQVPPIRGEEQQGVEPDGPALEMEDEPVPPITETAPPPLQAEAPPPPTQGQIPYVSPGSGYQNPYAPVYAPPPAGYPPYVPPRPYPQNPAAPAAPYGAPPAGYPPCVPQQANFQNPAQPAHPPYGAPPPYANPRPPYAPPVAPYGQPQPAQGYPYPPQAPRAEKKAGSKAWKIVLWIVGGLLELAIIGFAAFGIYTLCTPQSARPGINGQGQSGMLPNPSFGQDGDQNTTDGKITSSAKLGMTCGQLSAADAAQYGVEQGLVVISIDADSDAAKQDIQPSDIITHINGTRVKTFEDYYPLINAAKPGDTFALTICRLNDDNTETQTVNVSVKLVERTTENSNFPQA